MNRTDAPALDLRLMNNAAVLLFAVFLCAVALSATRWVSNRAAFSLQGITVQGDVGHANVPTVRAHVVSRVAGSFFSIDLAKTRNVFETMPWVRHAVVHRDFPNRLRVQLQEHQVAAYWGDANEPRLLNTFGDVFDANVGRDWGRPGRSGRSPKSHPPFSENTDARVGTLPAPCGRAGICRLAPRKRLRHSAARHQHPRRRGTHPLKINEAGTQYGP